jgi:hypothetical protein
MKHRQMEKLIITDANHLLRFKENQGYISYQLKRIYLYIKHLIINEEQNQ